MNVVPIFINFLATETLKIDNGRIEAYAQGLKKAGPGRVISNSGGWQSNNLDPQAPAMQELFEAVDAKLNELHAYFNFDPSRRQVISEAWMNINNRGGFNRTHNHPGSLFSCVYYVNGGEKKGNIMFTTPIEAHAYTIADDYVASRNAFSASGITIPPVTGQLLIFPAWLMHYVMPNETDEDRISVALNSRLLLTGSETMKTSRSRSSTVLTRSGSICATARSELTKSLIARCTMSELLFLSFITTVLRWWASVLSSRRIRA